MILLLPPFNTPLVDKSFILTEPYRIFFNNLLLSTIIQGTGSPEGVVEGFVGQTYIDLDGEQWYIRWIKRDAAIDGDRTRGWFAG